MNWRDIIRQLETTQLYGNGIDQVIWAALVGVSTLVIVGMLQRMVIRSLQQPAEVPAVGAGEDETSQAVPVTDTWSYWLAQQVQQMSPITVGMLALYAGSMILTLSDRLRQGLFIAVLSVVLVQVIVALQQMIDLLVRREVGQRVMPGSESAVRGLAMVAKYGLWVLAALLVISNMGIQVGSLIAGLGIGGIAVAFALQQILGDIFSSFAIYFDRPFEVGDFVVVNGQSGTVRKISLRSTRIKALQGEEIVIPNNQITAATIQNFRQLQERRVELHFGVTYETPPTKLAKIPELVAEIVDGLGQVHLNRVHLSGMGDFSIVFEVVYVVESSEYGLHMDIKQAFFLALTKRFAKEKIEFAYPTHRIVK